MTTSGAADNRWQADRWQISLFVLKNYLNVKKITNVVLALRKISIAHPELVQQSQPNFNLNC